MKTYIYDTPFVLENGQELKEVTIAYHTYGKLNSDKSNVVWVCHALTANSDVADWWDGLFGEGKLLYPNKYFIICANIIISCYGSTGPANSPMNAWVLSKSLETLEVRIEHHFSSALEIARRLEQHEKVNIVKYPHLQSHPQFEIAKRQMKLGGGLITFEHKDGLEGGNRFLDGLKMFSLTANLGDTRSIATHPASTTHSKLSPEKRSKVGIGEGTVRLSIGLEGIEDIWRDLEQALK